MNRKVKKALDIASIIALVAFILMVVLLAGVRLFGIEPHIVLSGSMEPEIMTGSLVYVKPISAEEAQNLKPGETVTFIVNSQGTKVTHKIYEVVGPSYMKNQHGEYILDDNGQQIVAKDDSGNPIIMYTTYGINNKSETSPTGYTLDGKLGVGNLGSSNVIGKPVFSIPLLGYVANFVQNPPGKYICIVVCVFLIVSTIFSGSSKKAAAEQAEEGKEPSANDPPNTEDKHNK